MKNEIVLYQSDELASRIEVRIESDTVWLNRQQLAALFGRDIKTIGKHIGNVFSEGELDKGVVVANFATTTSFDNSSFRALLICLPIVLISLPNNCAI